MRQPAEIEVTLPHGRWKQGRCVRQGRVRAIPEGAPDLSENLAEHALPIRRVSALLERCVTISESLEQDEPDWTGELSLGDREALLLHIRRLTFGGRIPCTLQCPRCAESMDFELQAHQLVLPEAENPEPFYEEAFQVNGTRWRVRFRIPRACDLEAVIVDTDQRTDEATAAVLRSCIDWVRTETGSNAAGNAPPSPWPAELEAQISARMAELDPQAEIALQLGWPACGHDFSSTFDSADYFFRELESREKQLLYYVHRLALAYHWTERDILRMTPRKRKLYLELLEEGFSSE